jgi:hypothetical protein
MRILPHDHGCAGKKQYGRGNEIAHAPTALNELRIATDRFWLAHSESQAELFSNPPNPLIFNARAQLCKPSGLPGIYYGSDAYFIF